MKRQGIWNFYAKFYNKLFTQKYSLRPTRLIILDWLNSFIINTDRTYRILDCGCGTGQLIFEIKERFLDFNLEITGIDLSQNMIEMAEEQNKYSGIRFINGNVVTFNSLEEYDIIVSTHAMPYFPDMDAAIKKCFGLLKGGGLFCMAQAASNNNYDKTILALLELVSSEAMYPSTSKIQELIEKAGFKDIYLKYVKETRLLPTIFALRCGKAEEI